MSHDIRFALRLLWKDRGFTLIAVLTMGLAIGATTSMFSIVEATLIRSLPFPEPKQLMMLFLTRSENGAAPVKNRWAYPRFLMLKQNATAFEDFATFGATTLDVTGIDQPLRLHGETASATYFAILRARAFMGRVFLPEEDARPGEKAVTVLGFGMWKRLFGGRDDVIGKTIGINQVPFTIIGVMPEDFSGLSGEAELWVPNMMAPVIAYPQHLTSLQNFHNVIARLRPGVSASEAIAEMDVIGRRIATAFPQDANDRGTWSATAARLDDVRIDPVRRRSQLILFGAVLFVLLIACVNMASLLLSRAASREREVSIRRALGCSRRRLVRQLLTESIVLALMGGLVGLVLTIWTSGTISDWIPPHLPAPGSFNPQVQEFSGIRINATVLAFAAGISLVTGLVFGLAPSLYCSGERGRFQRSRKFGAFVVTEFALALTLMAGAALMIESFARLQRVNAGFNPANVLTFYIQPPQQRYPGRKGPELLERLLERVTAVPGVESATVSLCTPLISSCARSSVLFDGPGQRPVTVGRHYIGPDHFKTLGIPLIHGRSFTPADRVGAPSVAIINESAARRFFPNEDAVGKLFRFGSNPPFETSPNDSLEIVGVVGDVKYGSLEEAAGADFYTPYMQFSWWFSYVMVRTSVPPASLTSAMRRAAVEVDPTLPIDSVMTMEDRLGLVNQRPRFSTLLLSIFAGLAMMLAAIGIYGVSAQSVSRRTQEIGIRMALGATPRAVSNLVLLEGLKHVALGVGLGIGGAWALTRVLQSQLFEVNATHPVAFAIAAALLIAVGLLACYFPARRAMSVDPIVTLRRE